MKRKILAALAFVCAVSLMTACGEKAKNTSSATTSTAVESSDSGDSSKAEKSEISAERAIINYDEMEAYYKDVESASEGPEIYFSNTTAKAGEYAEITLYVDNVEKKWNMCGIHIVYPDFLKTTIIDQENRLVECTKGDASKNMEGSVCMEWQTGLPEVLTSNKLGCTFFTCMSAENHGMNGSICTLKLKVPDNAQSGAVYNIGSYFMDTDLFTNAENDISFQKYAFEHMKGGTITIE